MQANQSHLKLGLDICGNRAQALAQSLPTTGQDTRRETMEHANDVVTLLALLGMLVAIHIRIRKV